MLGPATSRLAEQHKPIPIGGTSLVARVLPVSHVLGSCAIHLKDTETGATLLYSGDLGPISESQLTLPDLGGTSMIEGADVLIMESAYGLLRPEEREGRRRASHGRERATKILSDVATKTLDGRGHMLLPAFSLGRTQELAMLRPRHHDNRDVLGPRPAASPAREHWQQAQHDLQRAQHDVGRRVNRDLVREP